MFYWCVELISKWLLSWICFILVKLRITIAQCDIIPQLHSKESSLTKHLIRRRGLLNRAFRPPYILRNGFVQTFAGLLCWPMENFQFEREYLQTADKFIVALDWFKQSTTKLKRNSPIVLIFPRLTGDAISTGPLCKLVASRGMRAVEFNRRGHGVSFLLSAKLTSIGDTNDTRKVIEYIFNKYPYVQIIGIGIGAGSATLFSYLGEFGSSSLMKAAVNISPSYDNTEKLCEQIPKLYELYLLMDLKVMLIKHWKVVKKLIDVRSVLLKAWSLKDFDYQVYCKMYGIETFEAFWQRNDPMRDVDDIAVPVLCINSLDDPVSVKENIPFDLFQFYPNLLLVTVEKGGHCAFYENMREDSWVNTIALNYIEYVLEFISNSKFWHR
ncbi:protein ABHD15-like [Ruditapes philippinarum]|uniref:protein ABHD15-like n=1 Tax=Ruditapes philippinarum TaxID=129788 RepID=UPI00295BE1C8|nr:protein ABHD15-like [Ruditapes philippinarum]